MLFLKLIVLVQVNDMRVCSQVHEGMFIGQKLLLFSRYLVVIFYVSRVFPCDFIFSLTFLRVILAIIILILRILYLYGLIRNLLQNSDRLLGLLLLLLLLLILRDFNSDFLSVQNDFARWIA